MSDGTRLSIALQKSGRLSEDSLKLLADCNIRVSGSKGMLKADTAHFPATLLFLRDDDIPQYVADGVADIGIVGQNVLLEKGHAVTEKRPLGFGKCRLSLAVQKHIDYPGLAFFEGKEIATSYPGILGSYLKEHGVQASIHEISGSVEIAPSIGMAEGVFDIVSSGSTLFLNGLKEVEVVMRSEAVLVSRKGLPAEKEAILEKLLARIDAVIQSRQNKYLLLNAPNERLEEVIATIPGVKSPTVMPLAESGWSAIHSVIQEEDFWGSIDRLKALGVQGILVVPIEKMIL